MYHYINQSNTYERRDGVMDADLWTELNKAMQVPRGEWFRLGGRGRKGGNEGWRRWHPKLGGGQRVRLSRVAVSLAERNEAMKGKGREGVE